MLSTDDCRLRADECLSAAYGCADERLAREWRLMAAEWRLAGDVEIDDPAGEAAARAAETAPA